MQSLNEISTSVFETRWPLGGCMKIRSLAYRNKFMMILIFGVHIILRTQAGRVRYGLCLLMQLRHLVVAPRSLARTPPGSLLASSPGPFQDPSDPLCSANACLEARSDPLRAARTPRLLRTTKICPPQTSVAPSHPPSAWGDASRFSGVSGCRGVGAAGLW